MPIRIRFSAQFCLLRDVGDFGFSSRLDISYCTYLVGGPSSSSCCAICNLERRGLRCESFSSWPLRRDFAGFCQVS